MSKLAKPTFKQYLKALNQVFVDPLKTPLKTILEKPKVPPIQEPKIKYIKEISEIITNVIIDGSRNPFTKTAYKSFRETHGKNRSPDLDAMILRNGGILGNPYCIFGIQDILRACENVLGIQFDIPRGGGVLNLWNNVNQNYKRISPAPFYIGLYRLKGTASGHGVIFLKDNENGTWLTFEFNTSPNKDSVMIRDGEGCYFKERNVDGFGDMELLGFVNIFEAVN